MEDIKTTHDYFNKIDLTTNDGRIKHLKGLYIEAGHHLQNWYKYRNRYSLGTMATYVKCMQYLMETTTLDEVFKDSIENEIFKPFNDNKEEIYK